MQDGWIKTTRKSIPKPGEIVEVRFKDDEIGIGFWKMVPFKLTEIMEWRLLNDYKKFEIVNCPTHWRLYLGEKWWEK
jgi:hypothetical protein